MNNYEKSQARVNVTYAGQNGDLPDTVYLEASDHEIRTWVAEAVRHGSIPGIRPTPSVNLYGYVVDRFRATTERPYNLIQLRPKTPFG